MNEPEIKPCPFCGKQAQLIVDSGPDAGYDDYTIGCDCIAGIEVYGCEVDGETEESVTARWNARPGEDRLRVQRDQARKALVKMAGFLKDCPGGVLKARPVGKNCAKSEWKCHPGLPGFISEKRVKLGAALRLACWLKYFLQGEA
jgi:hypothetical protein